jgi:amino acid permease
MHYSSTRTTVTNIVYSVINGGLVLLPFFASQAGIPLYITLVALVSTISCYTSIMVVSMANEKHKRTLEDLAESAFGPKGFLLVCTFQILFSFTLMCISLDVWADILANVFDDTRSSSQGSNDLVHYLLRTRQGEVIVGAAIVLPMCVLKKSMASLRWTNVVNVLAIPAALLAVVASYMSAVHDSVMSVSSYASVEEVSAPKHQWYAVVLGVIFCFSFNQKVFMLYSGLRRRSANRWQTAVRRASLVISIIYILFGCLGYISKERKGESMTKFNYFVEDNFTGPEKIVYDTARFSFIIMLANLIVWALCILICMFVVSISLCFYKVLWLPSACYSRFQLIVWLSRQHCDGSQRNMERHSSMEVTVAG